MYKYIIKRTLLVIPTLIGAAALVFFLLRMIPGDVCELPVSRDLTLCVGGYRTVADGLMAMLDAPAESYGDDRVLNLPNITVSVSQHVPKPHTPFQWAAMETIPDTLGSWTPPPLIKAIDAPSLWPMRIAALFR